MKALHLSPYLLLLTTHRSTCSCSANFISKLRLAASSLQESLSTFSYAWVEIQRPGESSGLVNYYLNRIIFSIWVLFWFIRLCLKLYNDYRSLDIWDVVDLTNLVLLSWQILNRFQWETTNTMVTTFDSYAGHDSYIDFTICLGYSNRKDY